MLGEIRKGITCSVISQSERDPVSFGIGLWGKSIANKQLSQLKRNLQKALRLEWVIKTERFRLPFVLGLLLKRVPTQLKAGFSNTVPQAVWIFSQRSRSLRGVWGGLGRLEA